MSRCVFLYQGNAKDHVIPILIFTTTRAHLAVASQSNQLLRPDQVTVFIREFNKLALLGFNWLTLACL